MLSGVHKQFRWLIAAGALLAAMVVAAEPVPYAKIVDLEARSENIVVRHHHDWYPVAHGKAGNVRYSLAEPFGVGNDYAYVSAHSLADGAALWRVPSAPFTWLGISPEGRYIIGLSAIKLGNPTQLAVFTANGGLIGRTGIADRHWCVPRATRDAEIAKLPEAQQAVPAAFAYPACLPNAKHFGGTPTNYISWYYGADPAPRVIEEAGRVVAVELRDPTGAKMRIAFDSGSIVR